MSLLIITVKVQVKLITLETQSKILITEWERGQVNQCVLKFVFAHKKWIFNNGKKRDYKNLEELKIN